MDKECVHSLKILMRLPECKIWSRPIKFACFLSEQGQHGWHGQPVQGLRSGLGFHPPFQDLDEVAGSKFWTKLKFEHNFALGHFIRNCIIKGYKCSYQFLSTNFVFKDVGLKKERPREEVPNKLAEELVASVIWRWWWRLLVEDVDVGPWEDR